MSRIKDESTSKPVKSLILNEFYGKNESKTRGVLLVSVWFIAAILIANSFTYSQTSILNSILIFVLGLAYSLFLFSKFLRTYLEKIQS